MAIITNVLIQHRYVVVNTLFSRTLTVQHFQSIEWTKRKSLTDLKTVPKIDLYLIFLKIQIAVSSVYRKVN